VILTILVSKPYRYARKAFKKILAELVLYVSKPYRYARKPKDLNEAFKKGFSFKTL